MENKSSIKGGTCSSDYITSFPFDVLLRVVLNLDPPDILQLRQTCRKLFALTKEKITWIRALRLACLRHGVVYPIHAEETSAAEELEHAVMCHYKFASRLRAEARSQNANRKLDPLRVREIQPSQDIHTIDGHPIRGFKTLALVAGGRFLVTIGLGFSLQVWDITAPGLDLQALKAEIRIPLPEDQMELMHFDVQAEAVRKGGTKKIIALVTARTLSDIYTGIYLLYSVELESDTTSFMEVGRLSFQDGSANADIDGTNEGHLISQRNYVLTSCFSMRENRFLGCIWNYEEDTLSNFKLPKGTGVMGELPEPMEITLLNNHLVALGHNSIEYYELAPFYPRTARLKAASYPVCISKTLLDEHKLGPLVARSTPYCDPNDNLLVFHLLGPDLRHTPEVCTFHCYASSFQHVPTTPLLESLKIDHSSWRSIRFSNCDLSRYGYIFRLCRTYKLPYHDQALMWRDRDQTAISFRVLKDGQEADIEILASSQEKELGVRVDHSSRSWSISFCPFSGRLCYIGKSQDIDEQVGGAVIRVVDYV